MPILEITTITFHLLSIDEIKLNEKSEKRQQQKKLDLELNKYFHLADHVRALSKSNGFEIAINLWAKAIRIHCLRACIRTWYEWFPISSDTLQPAVAAKILHLPSDDAQCIAHTAIAIYYHNRKLRENVQPISGLLKLGKVKRLHYGIGSREKHRAVDCAYRSSEDSHSPHFANQTNWTSSCSSKVSLSSALVRTECRRVVNLH